MGRQSFRPLNPTRKGSQSPSRLRVCVRKTTGLPAGAYFNKACCTVRSAKCEKRRKNSTKGFSRKYRGYICRIARGMAKPSHQKKNDNHCSMRNAVELKNV